MENKSQIGCFSITSAVVWAGVILGKVFGVLTWSWWVVLIPLWVSFIVYAILAIVLIIILFRENGKNR